MDHPVGGRGSDEISSTWAEYRRISIRTDGNGYEDRRGKALQKFFGTYNGVASIVKSYRLAHSRKVPKHKLQVNMIWKSPLG